MVRVSSPTFLAVELSSTLPSSGRVPLAESLTTIVVFANRSRILSRIWSGMNETNSCAGSNLGDSLDSRSTGNDSDCEPSTP